MIVRINVRSRHTVHAAEVIRGAQALGISDLTGCYAVRVYFLDGDLNASEVELLCQKLLVDPITETAGWERLDLAHESGQNAHADADAALSVVEVALRPGVTDVAARELVRGMVELGLPRCDVVTATRYELFGLGDVADVRRLARHLLSNETVQHYSLGPILPHFGVEAAATDEVEEIRLEGLNEAELADVSRTRFLALDPDEMRVIQAYYAAANRSPTDVELETLAQTWSEHCVHKTFRAAIDFTWQDANGEEILHEKIGGLLRTYIRAATEAVQPAWLRSAFVDDAGIIAFDDKNDLAFKVETHNHPSALEPFGGANTGVGGVVRDILGVSARPIATTDVLCFGPQDIDHENIPPGILHPKRIASGVVAGIGDYGNKLGLPTVNGAVFYNEGYLGNPLVFCGCVGLLPVGSHPTRALEGDLIVVAGGRTGRDGLHGATFSSAELTHETSETLGSAVQIGDPITEKGLIELVTAARDAALYNAITDCGAGGLSSSVGEMGEELGVDVELANVLLKYPGLKPWEIWLSEAQERMVMAVPPQSLQRLQDLANLWGVELSVLGRFTGDGHLCVRYQDRVVADLPMSFLHDGRPQRHMKAVWQEPVVSHNGIEQIADSPQEILLRMLAHPSVASKEEIVRRYDHEVRGGTLVRPFVGPAMDGPSDAAVLKPLGTWSHNGAFALSVGINPLIGRRDPYAMAICAIDEAVRNAVAVGADPECIAILDNFCWGNPNLPDRLGALVRTCQGCLDGAVAYRTPFISGKDSLNNEFNGRPIPGTLLISAIGLVPDMQHVVTSHFKRPGNRLYLVGESRPELGGSLLHSLYGIEGGTAPTLPERPIERYRKLHGAILRGLVAACHDLSEGGLSVGLAEMALAGRLGASVDLVSLTMDSLYVLFGESCGRLLVEVAPDDTPEFERMLTGETLVYLGDVVETQDLNINVNGEALIHLPLVQLLAAWKGEVRT